jgi:hypothetical protein
MTHDQPKPLEPNQSQPEAQPQPQPTDPPADATVSSIDSEAVSEAVSEALSEDTAATVESIEPVEGLETVAETVAASGADETASPESVPAAPATASEDPIEVSEDEPKGDIDDLDNMADDMADNMAEEVPAPEPPIVATSSSSPSPPPATAPSTESPSTPSKTQALFRLVGQLWGIFVAFLPILGRFLQTVWKGVLTALKWVYGAWKAILPKLRSLLPAGWNKLPDWVLTTVAVSLLIFVFWLRAQLLPGKPPALAGDRTPPTLKAPAPAQPVAPTSEDPVLIARLQEQVAEVTDSYAEGLIQSVQANFRSDRLIVQLSNAWYGLDLATQNRLATELLNRSRKLEFDKLEMVDSEGELLARSPVVGAKMVIYERMRDEG